MRSGCSCRSIHLSIAHAAHLLGVAGTRAERQTIEHLLDLFVRQQLAPTGLWPTRRRGLRRLTTQADGGAADSNKARLVRMSSTPGDGGRDVNDLLSRRDEASTSLIIARVQLLRRLGAPSRLTGPPRRPTRSG